MGEAKRRFGLSHYGISTGNPLIKWVRGEHPQQWHSGEDRDGRPQNDPDLDHLGLPASLVTPERRANQRAQLLQDGTIQAGRIAETYLLSAGLTADDLARVRSRLLA